MTLKQLASLGKELAKFLLLFVGHFRSRPGFALLQTYVQGLLSNLQRKNIEAMALEFAVAPRTLQRFVESIKWDETGVRDDCQRLVAREHSHPEAIGCLDESGTAKSGSDTVGVARQWLGSCGKVDNGVVGVHLSYSSPGFQCLLDSEVYLPRDWADDPERRKKVTSPTRSCSVPSRKSPWSCSTAPWPTVCVSRPGRSTKATAATRPFWTVSNSVAKYSWEKCRRISTAG
jgi:SRSO17 transposase